MVGKAKLLLVDDNLMNLKVLRLGFASLDYDLYEARDGRAAIELAHSLLPDLILLDVMLPDVGGFDVCKQLKASPDTADIPIIFQSAMGQPIDKVYGLEIGGVDYVVKPFDFAEVRARVAVHLKLREQGRIIFQRQQQDLQSLESLNEIKSELLRRLKHDVKSPVTNIMLTVDILKRQGMVVDERGIQMLNRISQSTQAILNLFSNVIEFAKTENAHAIQWQEVKLGDFIDNVISTCVSDAEQKNINLNVTFAQAQRTDTGYFDADRMASVFLNLLSNAIKYTPHGGQITLNVEQANSSLIFKVIDNGYGIHPDDLPKLFSKYFRGQQPTPDIEGTGLGLFIVKAIIEQHGGQVSVESEHGHGSTFIVSLPINP